MHRGKPGLTYEQHQKLGRELYDIRNKLSAIWTLIAKAYPIHKHKHLPKKSTEAVDKLRTLLDKHIARSTTTAQSMNSTKSITG